MGSLRELEKHKKVQKNNSQKSFSNVTTAEFLLKVARIISYHLGFKVEARLSGVEKQRRDEEIVLKYFYREDTGW